MHSPVVSDPLLAPDHRQPYQSVLYHEFSLSSLSSVILAVPVALVVVEVPVRLTLALGASNLLPEFVSPATMDDNTIVKEKGLDEKTEQETVTPQGNCGLILGTSKSKSKVNFLDQFDPTTYEWRPNLELLRLVYGVTCDTTAPKVYIQIPFEEIVGGGVDPS
ncbi:hypothetical protein FRX31_017285 [Thalictrum thalictroides]|uniref:Uncharacterized protein n=1 Tax=Thalictrum thalictroides TaxID=46969 RepID=A0A7J6W8H1_THATH|nr:hypothetical protein FRX31_017285 [Thalictrum thalictroides]